MTMRDILIRRKYINEMEWHRRNAASLMKVRHMWPHLAEEIRNHLRHARYYKTILRFI
jgi:pyruvate/2-oxoacid:ferredoxin oxidoreductase alpha subunit